MGEEEGKRPSGEVAAAIDLVLTKTTLYQNVLQPAEKPAGELVVAAVRLALKSASALLWGYEQIENLVQVELPKRLSRVPPERVVAPPPIVAVPALELLRLAADEPSLREMYLNLLATSMDERTVLLAHPSFPEIIRQLSPDEAALFASLDPDRDRKCLALVSRSAELSDWDVNVDHFAFESPTRVRHPLLAGAYVDNLQRLSLVLDMTLSNQVGMSGEGSISERFPSIGQEFADFMRSDDVGIFEVELRMSNFGKQFHRACVSGAIADSMEQEPPQPMADVEGQ